MAGNGDLIRSLSGGGRAAQLAAQELVRRAKAGAVSPSELSEVQKLVSLPELRDGFAAMARELATLLTPAAELVLHDVRALLPDTEQLTDARALPERFLSDFTLLKGELLDAPGLTRTQKAERLVAFFAAYAARFTALAQGTAQAKQAQVASAALPAAAPADGGLYGAQEAGLHFAPPLTSSELKESIAHFEGVLQQASFEQIRAADGRSGLEFARQMLEARTSEALRAAHPKKVDAPTWSDTAATERQLAASAVHERRQAAVEPRPVIAPILKQPTDGAGPVKPEEERHRRTDRVLGGRMLWNVLHLMRGEDLDDVAKADAKTQLAIAACLVLGLIVILVGVLVLL